MALSIEIPFTAFCSSVGCFVSSVAGIWDAQTVVLLRYEETERCGAPGRKPLPGKS